MYPNYPAICGYFSRILQGISDLSFVFFIFYMFAHHIIRTSTALLIFGTEYSVLSCSLCGVLPPPPRHFRRTPSAQCIPTRQRLTGSSQGRGSVPCRRTECLGYWLDVKQFAYDSVVNSLVAEIEGATPLIPKPAIVHYPEPVPPNRIPVRSNLTESDSSMCGVVIESTFIVSNLEPQVAPTEVALLEDASYWTVLP